MARRWLVTGATGKLGGHLVEYLLQTAICRNQAELITVSRAWLPRHQHYQMDLTSGPELCGLLARARPTHIIHLAGLSSLEQAEAQPGAAWRINVDVTTQLAKYAQQSGCWFLMTSTDFVFGGKLGRPYREEDAPSPGSTYAVTKLAAETEVLNRGGTVARLSLLYGIPLHDCVRSTFAEQLLRLRRFQVIDVVFDEWRTPVWLRDAAVALVELGLMEFRGIVHIGGPTRLTQEQLMRKAADLLSITPVIRPISRSILGGNIRPEDVALDSTKLRRLLPEHLRPGPLRYEALYRRWPNQWSALEANVV